MVLRLHLRICSRLCYRRASPAHRTAITASGRVRQAFNLAKVAKCKTALQKYQTTWVISSTTRHHVEHAPPDSENHLVLRHTAAQIHDGETRTGNSRFQGLIGLSWGGRMAIWTHGLARAICLDKANFREGACPTLRP